ncbi:WLM domain-containing protein [Lophiotrema nucula]|uniref:WLM domain-containing protein n=1 Tax=Lophiotrema nucula TaxID=690887 RepID=A0A6A5ZUA8_9PLEO|nr:WLM domain-containing protein [Lophiotrema nucula]
MPLGFERINERTQRPNALINFIRPLSGSTAPVAEAILNRVAAICYPFMKKHYIAVQALEEFPYNTEFVGRNFNAGEVIQLVLKNKKGEWLPEKWIMMVMVHELAHCKQMNHSQYFWKVRNEYAKELQELWSKGYTGEGLWGSGRSLDTGNLHAGSVEAGDVPEHLCGGTYSRRRKRRRGGKQKEDLTYAERKQRQILKKFGAGGHALGADDNTKVKLEGGVAKKGTPRVAGSARGRDLRAAAALARFEPVKKEEPAIKQEEVESDSETEDDTDADSGNAATDVDGKKMMDGKGHALVKVCDDEDAGDGNARREMDEIQGIDLERPSKKTGQSASNASSSKNVSSAARPKPKAASSRATSTTSTSDSSTRSSAQVIHLDEIYKRQPETESAQQTQKVFIVPDRQRHVTCPICSLSNAAGALTCVACSNVLNPNMMPNHWKCSSSTCRDSKYVNSGDAGVCGVCGTPRQAR